jgi:PAS domain S-box-containing protein
MRFGFRFSGFRFALLAIFVAAAPAFAAEGLPIRVGSELDFRPYCFTDENGQPTGFAVELLQAVAEKATLDLQISPGEWDKVWNSLLAGKIDVLPVVARTPGREGLVEFTLPHTETYDAFFISAGRPPLKDLAAAAGKEIVVLRSDAAHHQLVDRKFSGRIVPVDSIAEGLQLIASGRHDALLCSRLIGVLERDHAGIRGVTDGPVIPDYKRVFSFAVRKGDSELAERLNQGLRLVQADGTYDRLYRKWLGAERLPQSRWQTYFWQAIGIVGVLVLIAATWIVARKTLESDRLNSQGSLSVFWRYALSVLAVSAGYAVRIGLEEWGGHGLPTFVTFYPAVMVAALLGGVGPGLLATAVSAVIADIWIMMPSGQLWTTAPVDRVAIVLFCGMGLFMTAVAELYRGTRAKAAAFDRETALRETRQEKEFLASLLETAEQPFAVCYPDGRIGQVNRAFEQLTGYTAAELHTLDWCAVLTPPELRDYERRKLAEIQGAGQPVRYEKEYVRKDGTRVPIELLVTLRRAAAGQPEFYYAFINDITARREADAALHAQAEQLQRSRQAALNLARDATIARRQAEESAAALRESERKLIGVLESMPDAFVSFDTQLHFTYVNANAERLQSARRDELLGKDVRGIYSDEQSQYLISECERVIREQTAVTLSFYHTGFNRWLEGRAFPTPDGVSIFYKDVSAQIKAEKALRRSETRWNAAIENFAIGAIIASEDEQVIYWNPAAREMHGYTRPDQGLEPLEKTPVTFQLWTLDSSHMLELDEWPMRRIKRGEVVRNLELRVRRPDQGWEKIFSYSGAMVETANGERLIFLSCYDLTELRRAEEYLRASLEEKEVLLKEIHHRVKNNMQVISSLVSLQADQTQNPALREVLRDVTHRVRSMALVHEKLYQSADLAQIDFAEYTRSLLSYLWRAHGTLAANVRLTVDLQPVPLPVSTAVPCGLILNELAGNALRHAFRKREADVETAGSRNSDRPEVKVTLGAAPEGRVCLSVRDNGTGLPAGFDWRQTKTLGLRLVQILAGQVHATVEVASGEGTGFVVTFMKK